MGVRLSGAFVLWSEKNGKNIIHCHLSTIEEEIEIKMLFALAIIADRGLCCIDTVVCIKVHKIVSLWCKTALGEVGVSLP